MLAALFILDAGNSQTQILLKAERFASLDGAVQHTTEGDGHAGGHKAATAKAPAGT